MGNFRGPAAGGLLLVFLLGIFYSSADGKKLVMMPAVEQLSKFVGDSSFVSCDSESENTMRLTWINPEGQQITDYEGSVPYNQVPRIHVEDGKDGNKGVFLYFENITRQDRGNYTCSANVDGVEESLSFELLVHKKIDFQNTPQVQYLEEGSNSTLHCEVDGDPMVNVTWHVNDKKISYSGKYERGQRENSLIVKHVTLADRGTYQCHAVQLSPHVSEFKDFDIDVKVHHKPLDYDDGMEQAYSFLEGRVNLTCEAVAEPRANFTWIKDGQLIYPSDNIHIFTDEHTSILQLTINDPNQFGDYQCKAENKLGTLERVIVLEKGAKPPTPEFKIKRADVNALHLDLKAHNRDPTMPILAYRVQYKESGVEWSQAPAVDFQKGEEYVINSLNENTLYVLRAAAKNAAGYSDFTGSEMLRTEKVQAGSFSSSTPQATPFACLAIIMAALAVAAQL